MSKITSEQIKEALKKYSGSIERLKTGTARNASMDGSICAASFGLNLLGQARSRKTFIENIKDREKIKQLKKELRSKKKVTSWNCATNKQIRYLESMGCKIYGKLSKVEASNEIKKILRVTEKINRKIQKRIDLDE